MVAARPRVRADVFPAIVTVAPAGSATSATNAGRVPDDHRRIDKTRVVVTMDTILVFQDAPGSPQLIFSERLASYTPPPSPRTMTMRQQAGTIREATVVTDSGKTLSFNRAGGCGCGSRLKSFDPFSATYSEASNSLAASSADV